MFGLRLKSWMEAHLGRPRHKSTSSSSSSAKQQQQVKASKETSSSSTSTSTSGATTISLSTTSGTSAPAAPTCCTSSNAPFVHSNYSNPSSGQAQYSGDKIADSDSNRNPFNISAGGGGLMPTTVAAATEGITISPCSSSAEERERGGGGRQGASISGSQQQEMQQQLLDSSSLSAEQIHHLNQQQQQQQRQARSTTSSSSSSQLQPSVSSTSTSNSSNILLGSFSNNLSLSSPDTGYSTDGYSPKSVYPALSFESSGKSTPKSSYTISSLVSSERLHLNNSLSCASSKSICTGGGPSKNSSLSNGLELEEDVSDIIPNGEQGGCSSSSPSSSSPHSNNNNNLLLDSSSGELLRDAGVKNSTAPNEKSNHGNAKSSSSSSSRQLIESSSINSEKGALQGNAALSKTLNSSISSTGATNPKMDDCPGSGMAPGSHHHRPPPMSDMESREDMLQLSNSKVYTSKGFEKHDFFNHRRTESMGEQRAVQLNLDDLSDNSASGQVNNSNNKSIRTSLLLSSQIPECYPGLKNAFSLCSPRRQRTRIKTNPWIKFTEPPDNNYQVNYLNTTAPAIPGMDGKEAALPIKVGGPAFSNIVVSKGIGNETQGNPLVDSHSNMRGEGEGGIGRSRKGADNNTINNEVDADADEDGVSSSGIGSSSGMSGGTTESGNNNNSTPPAGISFFRISSSTSASDSGKGTLEPGTNRNSTESSCLLSDSTSNSGSNRNSIISPESETKSGSLIIFPGISNNAVVHARLDQCVSNHSSVKTVVPKTSTTSTSSSAAHNSSSGVSGAASGGGGGAGGALRLPDAVNQVPSICISNPVKPSVKQRLNSNSEGKGVTKLEGIVGAPGSSGSSSLLLNRFGNYENYANNMVDKETDILSDWANTDDDDGEGEEEDDEEEEEEDDEDDSVNGNEAVEDGENDNDCITPTPSSPDVTFNNSSCSSGKMDYIQVSDHGGAFSAKLSVNGGSVVPDPSRAFPYQHNMNLPTTCYPSIPISSRSSYNRSSSNRNPIHEIPGCDNPHLNQASLIVDQSSSHVQDLTTGALPSLFHHHLLTPAAPPTSKCLNNTSRITNNNVKAQNPSHTIARGAIGFLRKMFKKGSCSSQKSGSGGGGGMGFGGKPKFFRTSRSNSTGDKDADNIDSNTIIPVGLLSPEAIVVNNYPLSNTKPLSPAINNGSFLTPTPNAFRRRNRDSSSDSTTTDGKVSKHSHKAIKTDIIRLPPNTTSSSTAQPPSSSSSLQSSQSSAIVPTTKHQHAHQSSHGHYYYQQENEEPNTNTNSTTGSSSAHSLSIMSTSTTSRSDQPPPPPPHHHHQHHHHHQEQMTPVLNQHHHELLSTHAYSNVPSDFPRQSPFMSKETTHHHSSRHRPHHNNGSSRPGSQVSTPIVQSSHHPTKGSQGSSSSGGNNGGMIIGGREPPVLIPKAGPYESPRLPSTSSSRINSPCFNNYSPIHRLVVTGGNHLLGNRERMPGHGSSGPPPPPAPAAAIPATSSFLPNNNQQQQHNYQQHHSPVPMPRTPNSQLINRAPSTTASPLINNRHSNGSSSSASSYPHQLPFVNCSPSPILRNPRYQYITSSNQNSPLLNIPKRLNNNVGGSPRGAATSATTAAAGINPNPGPSQVTSHHPPIFHSPSLNSTSISGAVNSGSNNYKISQSFPAGNPEPPPLPSCASPRTSNFLSQQLPQPQHPSNNRSHMQNTNNNNHRRSHNGTTMTNGITSYPPDVPVDTGFHHQSHYYSSPITRDPPPRAPSARSFSTQQFYQLNGVLHPMCSGGAERIYESVDDSEEEDEMRSDEGDGEGGDFELELSEFRQEYRPHQPHHHHHQQQQHHHHPLHHPHPPRRDSDLIIRRGVFDSDSLAGMSSPPLLHPHMNNNNRSSDCGAESSCNNGPWKSKSASKPRRSKTFSLGNNSTATTTTTSSHHQQHQQPQQQRQQPPVPPRFLPMMLGTYLSETETRLLEADNDTDRKYKRLISEAEALLKEISIEKSQPSPWLSRYAKESLRQDDCPQSDPLRRKAYDCWALRRLQQELAGCCASPPVLHRSRLHITSPVSPSPNSQNRNLSLAQYQPEFPFFPNRRSSISSTSSNPPPPF